MLQTLLAGLKLIGFLLFPLFLLLLLVFCYAFFPQTVIFQKS